MGELALSVVFESGWQHSAGSIVAYQARPELERLLEQVPTVWDETQLLDGHPGVRVTPARRSGERWFVGSVVGGAAATSACAVTDGSRPRRLGGRAAPASR